MLPAKNKSNVAVWQQAWRFASYRNLVIIGVVVLAALILTLPIYFTYIQNRDGIILHDYVLAHIPAMDMTIYIFAILWLVIGYTIIRSCKDPQDFIVTIYSVIFVCAFRNICLFLVPLDPPIGLVPIRDPLSNLFYGGHATFVTKDLFFSGHTASMFLCFLCLKGKYEKLAALLATIAIGSMVLIQHVHYVLDVVAAPIFTYLAYLLSKKVTAMNS